MVKRAALSLRTILLIAIGLSWFSGAMADLSDGLVAYYPIPSFCLNPLLRF